MHDRPTKFRTSDNRNKLSSASTRVQRSPRDLEISLRVDLSPLTLRPFCVSSFNLRFSPVSYYSRERERERESLILKRRSFSNEWRVPPHKSSVDKLEELRLRRMNGWRSALNTYDDGRWRGEIRRGNALTPLNVFLFNFLFLHEETIHGFLFRDFGLGLSRFIGYHNVLRSVWKIFMNFFFLNFFLLNR